MLGPRVPPAAALLRQATVAHHRPKGSKGLELTLRSWTGDGAGEMGQAAYPPTQCPANSVLLNVLVAPGRFCRCLHLPPLHGPAWPPAPGVTVGGNCPVRTCCAPRGRGSAPRVFMRLPACQHEHGAAGGMGRLEARAGEQAQPPRTCQAFATDVAFRPFSWLTYLYVPLALVVHPGGSSLVRV